MKFFPKLTHFSRYSDTYLALLLILIGLFTRFLFLELTDGAFRLQKDAYCRTYEVKRWFDSGQWLPHSIWPPLTHILTGSLKPFFSNFYYAGTYLSAFLGGLNFGILFILARKIKISSALAFTASLFLLLIWTYTDMSTHAMTEPIQIFFTFSGILMLLNNRVILAALFIGLSCFIRVESILILGYFGAALLWQSYKERSYRNFIKYSLTGIWFPLLLGLYYHLTSEDPFMPFKINNLLSQAERILYPIKAWEALERITYFLSTPLLIAIVVTMVYGLLRDREPTRRFLLPIILILIVSKIFSIVTQELPPEARYILWPVVLALPICFHYLRQLLPKALFQALLLLIAFSVFDSSYRKWQFLKKDSYKSRFHGLIETISTYPANQPLAIDIADFDAFFLAHHIHHNAKVVSIVPNPVNIFINYKKDLTIYEIDDYVERHETKFYVYEPGYSEYGATIEKDGYKSKRHTYLMRYRNKRYAIYEVFPKPKLDLSNKEESKESHL